MADTVPPRVARAMPGLVVAAGVALAVLGLVMAWHGLRPSEPAAGPPAAARSAVAVPGESTPSAARRAATSPVAAPRIGVRPRSVVVPALGLRAAVLPIATVEGALTPPDDPRQLGWWSGGARAGADTGAAVLTGHTVHTGGGALDDLEQLTSGDRVVVGSGSEQVAYAVDTVRVLSRDDLARRSTSLFSRSGPGRLVLITCEDWDGAAYRSNVVVVARPIR